METLFTWLHLSDLHVRAMEPSGSSALLRVVRPSGAFGAAGLGGASGSAPPPGMHERLLQALRDDLVENAEQRPDALMVTGDASLRGTRDDFIAARRWLAETARALGLGPERIFVVPGNHDVERDASARNEGLELRLLADLREGRRRLDLALEKPAARTLLAARLAPFCEFAFSFGPGTAPPADRLAFSHARTAAGAAGSPSGSSGCAPPGCPWTTATAASSAWARPPSSAPSPPSSRASWWWRSATTLSTAAGSPTRAPPSPG